MDPRLKAGFCTAIIAFGVGYDAWAQAHATGPADSDHTVPYAPIAVSTSSSVVASFSMVTFQTYSAITGDEIVVPATMEAPGKGLMEMAELQPPDNQRTDEQLLGMLAEPGLWLIRGGPGGVLGMAKDLQSALGMAFEKSGANEVVQRIVQMPSDRIAVGPEQIYRLWKHFKFTDAQGNLVG